MLTFEGFLDAVDAEERGRDLPIVVEERDGSWTLVHYVDVEEGDDAAIRFFRDDDIPGFLGAPGPRSAAGTLERAATPAEAERTATMRRRYPWNLPCRMSLPGCWRWHDVGFDRVEERDGYYVIVLRDEGESVIPTLW